MPHPRTPPAPPSKANDGAGKLAIHFRNAPNEAALRELLTTAADPEAADALDITAVEPADWWRKA